MGGKVIMSPFICNPTNVRLHIPFHYIAVLTKSFYEMAHFLPFDSTQFIAITIVIGTHVLNVDINTVIIVIIAS